MEYRSAMAGLSSSTVNVRLSAIRKMVGEARKNGMLGAEEAANLTEVPNIAQKGTRLGNWLTREQAKELLAVPDRSTLKGKRDYVILAMLVGCACAGRSSPGLISRRSNFGRGDGCWRISQARVGASEPSLSLSGSSMGSTPGRPLLASRMASCSVPLPKAARSKRA